ncbi:MAG: hypothetical protein R3A11_01480 [Bdellovibrionota bacterium]
MAHQYAFPQRILSFLLIASLLSFGACSKSSGDTKVENLQKENEELQDALARQTHASDENRKILEEKIAELGELVQKYKDLESSSTREGQASSDEAVRLIIDLEKTYQEIDSSEGKMYSANSCEGILRAKNDILQRVENLRDLSVKLEEEFNRIGDDGLEFLESKNQDDAKEPPASYSTFEDLSLLDLEIPYELARYIKDSVEDRYDSTCFEDDFDLQNFIEETNEKQQRIENPSAEELRYQSSWLDLSFFLDDLEQIEQNLKNAMVAPNGEVWVLFVVAAEDALLGIKMEDFGFTPLDLSKLDTMKNNVSSILRQMLQDSEIQIGVFDSKPRKLKDYVKESLGDIRSYQDLEFVYPSKENLQALVKQDAKK